ncbi:hypothetical protein [Chengkuizengella axinellae]|uniref:Uncharacterized protein n=1 Tax=Chengkuizengella axinellae TaxID=3064388 RepID=A0ABT9IZV0_9BACL|nr:hypothetical protein [Chengkuizengella sp. 2205SS18-9]MDP5274891.1 hypothetical protein [Chengkuizengella sp. 2205SS18-9]
MFVCLQEMGVEVIEFNRTKKSNTSILFLVKEVNKYLTPLCEMQNYYIGYHEFSNDTIDTLAQSVF